jgi:hypothetical protein
LAEADETKYKPDELYWQGAGETKHKPSDELYWQGAGETKHKPSDELYWQGAGGQSELLLVVQNPELHTLSHADELGGVLWITRYSVYVVIRLKG